VRAMQRDQLFCRIAVRDNVADDDDLRLRRQGSGGGNPALLGRDAQQSLSCQGTMVNRPNFMLHLPLSLPGLLAARNSCPLTAWPPARKVR